MRLESKDKIDNSDQNSQFFRTTNTNTTKSKTAVVEKHRLWLNLTNDQGAFKQTLLAYVTGATNTRDRMYDAITDYKSSQNFYSLLVDDVFAIQGRALPFDVNDKVDMGIKVPSSGIYTIAVGEVDGLFLQGQDIYLEDKNLNIIHNLKETSQGTVKSIDNLNHLILSLNQKDNVIGVLNDKDVAVKMKNIITNLDKSSAEIDKVVTNLYATVVNIKEGKGALNYLSNDENLVKKIDSTMTNLNGASSKLNENLEALKHNFLFRGYFKKQAKEKAKQGK